MKIEEKKVMVLCAKLIRKDGLKKQNPTFAL
jgi:hypothetical protein